MYPMKFKIAKRWKVAIFVAPFIALAVSACDPGTPAGDAEVLVDAHRTAADDFDSTVGQWGRDWARGWSQADSERAEPTPEPTCAWEKFGPCDQDPPLEFWGISDDNANGINDSEE